MKLRSARLIAVIFTTGLALICCESAMARYRELFGQHPLDHHLGGFGFNGSAPRHGVTAFNSETSQDKTTDARQLNDLALAYQHQGHLAEVEPLYRRSLKILESALDPEHYSIASTLNNLARLYYRQARYTEAEPLYQRSLAILEKTRGPDHPAVAESLNNLADLYRKQGRATESEAFYKRSEEIRKKEHGSSNTCQECR